MINSVILMRPLFKKKKNSKRSPANGLVRESLSLRMPLTGERLELLFPI